MYYSVEQWQNQSYYLYCFFYVVGKYNTSIKRKIKKCTANGLKNILWTLFDTNLLEDTKKENQLKNGNTMPMAKSSKKKPIKKSIVKYAFTTRMERFKPKELQSWLKKGKTFIGFTPANGSITTPRKI